MNTRDLGVPLSINTMFLRVLVREVQSEEAVLTASFAADPQSNDPRKWLTTRWLNRGTTHLPPNHNNYVAQSAFRRDPETGKFRRRKDLFSRLMAVMVDDIGTKISESQIALPFSCRIETSPGNFQGWYFVEDSDAARNLQTCETLIKAMIASGLTSGGKDPGMEGVNRFGRLPEGINNKKKYVEALGHPFEVRMVAYTDVYYSIDEISRAYDLDTTPPPPPRRVKLPKGVVADRSKQFVRLMQTLNEAGLYLGSRGRWHDIECPWADEHSDGDTTGTAIHEPSEENGYIGGFKCFHGHCADRTVGDVYRWKRHFEMDEESA